MADKEHVIVTLENAAQILLAEPNIITEEERRVAEQVLISFKKSSMTIDMCRQILEESTNDFVLYETSSLFKESLNRDWFHLNNQQIQAIHTYLLNYITNHISLKPYIRDELVQSLAIIYKRQSLSDEEKLQTLTSNTLFSDVAQLINSGNTFMQVIACSILASLINEFSSSSRTSKIGFTFEQHNKCKTKFESGNLKEIFVYCLQTFSQILSHSSVDDSFVLISQLLSVLEQILSWDFTVTSKKMMVFSRCMSSISGCQAVSFKPPLNWKDILLINDVMDVLLKIHLRVRKDENLSNQSLQCLTQLASMNGVIFSDESVHQDYVVRCLTLFLRFLSDIELNRSECLGIASLLNNLIKFNPMRLLLELPVDLLVNLLSSMNKLTCSYCTAANRVIEDDNGLFMESFEKMLDSWMTFINHSNDFPHEYLRQYSIEIFNTYLQCHLSTTDGIKNLLEEEDEDEEDKEKYSDQLYSIGLLSRYISDYTIALLTRLLLEKMNFLDEHLQRIQQQQPNGNDTSSISNHLYAINEDLHWLLLLTMSVLTEHSSGEVPEMPATLIDYGMSEDVAAAAAAAAADRWNSASIIDVINYNGQMEDLHINSIVKLIGVVFRFCQQEKRLVECEILRHHLSPQVTETLMTCISRLVATYLLYDEDYYTKMCLSFSISFGIDGSSSVSLIQIILDKIMSNICIFNSEPGVINQTLYLLTTLVNQKNRRNVTVKCDSFWQMASSFSSNSFPFTAFSPSAKKTFCQTLILASSADISSEQQKTYIDLVLSSIRDHFKNVLNHIHLKSILDDTSIKMEIEYSLDCLCAVAEATTSGNAVLVFEFLHPILDYSVCLLDVCHNYEEIVELILELFNSTTKHLCCYLSKGDSEKLYQVCYSLIEVFGKHNQARKCLNKDSETNEFDDLFILIQMMTNILSSDFISFSDDDLNSSRAADVVVSGLNLLLPLMTTQFLKVPTLCSSYLGLLSYVAEVHADHICQMSDALIMSLKTSVEFALNNHGTDITRICLELLTWLATAVNSDTSLVGSTISLFVKHFLEIIFNLFLLDTFDVNLMETVSGALYILISCHQERYRELVNELLIRYCTSSFYHRLLNAFNLLTPSNFEFNLSRQNKIQFMNNFNHFLVSVRGFLCVR